MKTLFCPARTVIFCLAFVPLLTSRLAGVSPELLFRDTFNTSANSVDVNFENSLGRQSGSAGVLSYLENTGGATDPLSQVNSADVPQGLRLEATAAQNYTAVSPNRNFTDGGNFVIEFDIDPGVNDPGNTSGDWACIVFGASSPLAFVNASDGMGILFRNNGAIQVFDGGTDTGGGGVMPFGQFHVRIEVTTADFAGGSPATVRMFVNGSPVQLGASTLEHVKAAGFRGNYLTLGASAFGGNNWVHAFDNLEITATPCVRPSTYRLQSYAGQTNQTVTITVPTELTLTSAVDVVVTSLTPSVAEPVGATAGSLTLTFPQGVTQQSFNVVALGHGRAVLALSTTADACIGGGIEVLVGGSLVANPSFESPAAPAWPPNPGYGPIPGWTQMPGGGVGVNDADGPFHNVGTPIPDRTQVGFIQGTGGLSQMLNGLRPGEQYWLQFRYDTRACCSGPLIAFRVRIGGVEVDSVAAVAAATGGNPYYSRHVVFTAPTDSALLEFATTAAGDRTLTLDAVTVVPRGADQVLVWNPSFEASGQITTPTPISPIFGWTTSGTVGVIRYDAGAPADNGLNPDQDMVAFIRGAGAISQVVSNLVIGQEYQIVCAANAAEGTVPYLRISMGGTILTEEPVIPVGTGNPYTMVTQVWTATATSAELRFEQVDPDPAYTLLLDDIRVLGLAVPPCETLASVQQFDLFANQPVGPDLVTITVPRYLVLTQNVQVIVTSADPAVAVPTGGAGGALLLEFTQGGTNALSFGITGVGPGITTFNVTNLTGCPGTSFLVRNRNSLVLNPSFEANSVGGVGYGEIFDWMGGSGVNNGAQPFADNGVIPDRGQIAFQQGIGSLSQVIYGLDTNRQYWLQFYVNARNCCGDVPIGSVSFNGVELVPATPVAPVDSSGVHVTPYYFINVPFTPNSPTGLLTFVSGPTPGNGDRTLLLDAVTLVPRDTNQVVIQNPSFEGSGWVPWPGYLSPAPIAGWAGTGNYGVNISGVGPFADNGRTSDQDNVAFLQEAGASLRQTITGLTPGQTYTLSYSYNARAGNEPRLVTTLGGTIVHDEFVVPVGGTAPYSTTNIPFTATGPVMELIFTQTEAGDHTVLIDDVKIVPGPPPAPPRLTIQFLPPDAVRISWPVSAGTAWGVRASLSLDGPFQDAGLPVWTEDDEYAVYDAVAGPAKYYLLAK